MSMESRRGMVTAMEARSVEGWPLTICYSDQQGRYVRAVRSIRAGMCYVDLV